MPTLLIDTACALTPAGIGWDAAWRSLLEGKRRFVSAREYLGERLPDVPIALVGDSPLCSSDLLGLRERDMARVLGGAMVEPLSTIRNGSRDLRIGCVVATSHGESGAISTIVDAGKHDVSQDVYRAILGEFSAQTFLDSAQQVMPHVTVAAACASGLHGVGLACDFIDAGILDACVVVAIDAISRVAVAGFRQVGAASRRGCSPFDASRDGTTVGEGAAAVLIASDKVARERITLPGRRLHLRSWAMNCVGRQAVEPSPDGIVAVINAALLRAGTSPRDVDAVFWHGTGTIQNDAAEAAAATSAFAERCPPGTSVKGVFGHSMGASGLLNLLAAAECCLTGIVPHAAGMITPAFPSLGIVAGQPLVIPSPHNVLAMALGFGGLNSCAVLSRGEQ